MLKTNQIRVNAERDSINGYGDRIVIETLSYTLQMPHEHWAVRGEDDVGFKNVYLAKREVAQRLGCHILDVRVVQ